MSELETDISRFADYSGQLKRYSSDSVMGALMLRLVENGISTGGEGEPSTEGSATAANQAIAIGILEEIRDGIQAINAPIASDRIAPELSIATTDGTIASGAKFVSIGIKAGTGTVLGAAVDTSISVIDFPYISAGYEAINYTVNAGSQFVILVGREVINE